MKVNEALEYIKTLIYWLRRMIGSVVPQDDLDALNVLYDYVIENRKKEEKYKWHDLRKNPEDLPDVNERVEIVLSVKNRYVNNFGTRPYGETWAVNGFITPLSVIAWREIEPFEEVNK